MIFTLALIYGTIARTVTPDAIGSFWFVIVGAFAVVGCSYLVGTILGYVIKIKNPIDFDALLISVSFPNIVALPILIFPALCEYPVVYEAFGSGSTSEMYQYCVDQSNTMVFCYFFSWSFLFWSLGHAKLMSAANKRVMQSMTIRRDPELSEATAIPEEQENDRERSEENEKLYHSFLMILWMAVKTTFASPGFLAMMFGFITACIPPLQKALFEPGGALRFLGASIDTLGNASSPMSTLVVAAALVPNKVTPAPPPESDDPGESDSGVEREAKPEEDSPIEESPIMSDPNFGPRIRRSSSVRDVSMVIRRRSSLVLDRIRRSDGEMMRLHIWFILSRLIVTPAIVCGVIVALDCGGVLAGIPDLGKLVLVINAALPGALIVIVLLKSEPSLSETAAVVAKVYLPSYLISIFTIAAWASVGLILSVPDENGLSFCGK
jgi:hypothetical protein